MPFAPEQAWQPGAEQHDNPVKVQNFNNKKAKHTRGQKSLVGLKAASRGTQLPHSPNSNTAGTGGGSFSTGNPPTASQLVNG